MSVCAGLTALLQAEHTARGQLSRDSHCHREKERGVLMVFLSPLFSTFLVMLFVVPAHFMCFLALATC